MYFSQRYNLLGAFAGYPSAPDIVALLESSLGMPNVSMNGINDFAVQEIGQTDYEAAAASLNKNKPKQDEGTK